MGGTLKDRVRDFIGRHHMIGRDDVVCVGCSGGADSTLLLVLLRELQEEAAGGESPFSLMVCHVNHHLRGEESDGDERFVRALAEGLSVPFYAYQADVAAKAAAGHKGLEEAGREARRAAFSDCLQNRGATKIALAHHADDQAETVLYHLARGSALRGLAGIRPADGSVIRPLLFLTREEIAAELSARNQTWREDSSNRSDCFARNRLRHNLIPEIEEQVHGGAARHMAETAEMVRLADEFLCAEAADRAGKHVARAACGTRISVADSVLGEPEIILRYILMDCLSSLAGKRKDIGQTHIRLLLELFGQETGKRISLPYALLAVRVYGGIVISRDGGSGFDAAYLAADEPVRICGSGTYRFGNLLVVAEILDAVEVPGAENGNAPDPTRIPRKTYTKWLSYDKIEQGLTIRNRQPGDYLVLDPDGHRQKLKSYLINEKVPGDARDRIVLIADGPRVCWAVGGRIGRDAGISRDTKRVIRIEVRKTDGNGGSGDE